MLLCLCEPTTEKDIARHAADGVETVAELGKRCGAGRGCGACHQQLARVLHNARVLLNESRAGKPSERDSVAL